MKVFVGSLGCKLTADAIKDDMVKNRAPKTLHTAFTERRLSGNRRVPTSRGIFSCLNCDLWDLGIFGITETRFSSESRIIADDTDDADF